MNKTYLGTNWQICPECNSSLSPGDSHVHLVDAPETAIKHDAEKLPMHLLPWEVTTYTASERLMLGLQEFWSKEQYEEYEDIYCPHPSALEVQGAARAMAFGAEKYGERNWEKGFKWSRLYAAAMRHVLSYQSGELEDPESGLSHMDHAWAMAFMLQAHTFRELGEDDRP